MKAKSVKGKTAGEIKAALEANITNEFKPTLATVFISAENERETVCKILSEKNIQIFGSSTGAEFTDGELETDSIVILLLDINPNYFYLKLIESSPGTTKETAEQIGSFGLSKFKKPAFLIVSGGLSTDGDEIAEGIKSSCGASSPVFGGLAADKLLFKRTYVFTNDMLTDHGLLALIVDEEKISIGGMAIGGWIPVGLERTITRSNGNIVYSIDNEPAMDFIGRYTGLKNIDEKSAGDILIRGNFQLQLKRENRPPVMRTPMQANLQDRSIVFAGSLPQGSKVRLCLLPGSEVIETTLNQFSEYKKQQPEADALIMFSCYGRKITLGPYMSEEIDGVKNIWNAPMAGFFCFGEIGRVVSGEYEFQNMTCSLAILKEK